MNKIPKEWLEKVLFQNKRVVKKNLAPLNFGNASARYDDYCIIKPSGVDLDEIHSSDIAVVEISSRQHVSGLEPSTDYLTHIELYQKFHDINGIVHTHSMHATAWAQASKIIPCLGTTHADYWKCDIPVTRELSEGEVIANYEVNTGKAIIEVIKDPKICPGVLVANHGPFSWGRSIEDAVMHAEILEYIAQLASWTLMNNSSPSNISKFLHNKHFFRKHGPDAYYGQKNI